MLDVEFPEESLNNKGSLVVDLFEKIISHQLFSYGHDGT
jgi:hypothetical protein